MKTLRFVFLLAMPILLWAGSATTSQDMGFRHMVVPRQQARPRTMGVASADSERVERLLSSLIPLRSKLSKEDLTLKVARFFIGVPYVAHTLDRNSEETLVVNMHGMDCTTYLENVIAVLLCIDKKQTSFGYFKQMLQYIRYRQGRLSYENRLHYYQWWIVDNQQKGFIRQIEGPNPPFTATQTLKINYMSENYNSYDMLRNRPERVAALKKMEDRTNGIKVRYIPKNLLNNAALLRKVVRNGDIIAITTRKRNLDTTHLGLAVWHDDGLHMINASSLKRNGRQVIEPKQTLYQYLMQQPNSTGIRLARLVLPNLR